MNEENNFSFLNNENSEPINSNPEPQPVSQDIFNGAPTPTVESAPEPVESLDVQPQMDSFNQTPVEPLNTVQPINETIEPSNSYVEPTPVTTVSD